MAKKITDQLLKRLKNNRPILTYILGLFVATRLILTTIGYASLRLFQSVVPPNMCMVPKFDMFHHRLINMWLEWDAGNYYNIAVHGYWVARPNYGFFPLYPLSIRVLHLLTTLSIPIAGIVLSNLALLVACWFLYRLVRLDHAEDVARRAVKYLLLLPVAFIFSGMLSESFFVLFAIIALYMARRSKWLPAALAGGLLALTRHIGVLIVVPLFFEYLQQRKFKLKKLGYEFLYLALVPAGLFIFMLFNKHIAGSYVAFAKIQPSAFHNPLGVVWGGLHTIYALPVALAALVFVAVIGYAKKLPWSLWIYGLIFALIPLLSGAHYYPSILRYTLVVFPVAIVLAQFAKKPGTDQGITIALALLQGFLMVMWVNCWLVYIV